MKYSHRQIQRSIIYTQKHQKGGGKKKQSSSDTLLERKLSNSNKHISKKKYLDWESRIVENCKRIIPKNGRPTIARRRKVVVVADMISKGCKLPMSELVKSGELVNIPEKHRIALYHMGNEKIDQVSLGYEEHPKQPGKKIFKHPATDFGGLTNVTQIIGEENITFENKTPFVVNAQTRVSSCTENIYKEWLTYSNKTAFYEKKKSHIRKGLKAYIQSLVDFLKENSSNIKSAHIQFYTLPTEVRMIYTSTDIKKQTGKYCMRVYSGDEKKHAKTVRPNNKTFTTIAYSENMKKPFITPNINMHNLMNEYVPMF